jgi:predicted Zn-dependent protease
VSTPAHEIGHVLGLDHAERNNNSVMFVNSNPAVSYLPRLNSFLTKGDVKTLISGYSK